MRGVSPCQKPITENWKLGRSVPSEGGVFSFDPRPPLLLLRRSRPGDSAPRSNEPAKVLISRFIAPQWEQRLGSRTYSAAHAGHSQKASGRVVSGSGGDAMIQNGEGERHTRSPSPAKETSVPLPVLFGRIDPSTDSRPIGLIPKHQSAHHARRQPGRPVFTGPPSFWRRRNVDPRVLQLPKRDAKSESYGCSR